MASRKPFGRKANPPTVDGASKLRSSFACTKAVLPADHATAPSGPIATWSIQRCFGSAAMVRLVPLTSVSTTLPSSPPETTTVSVTAVANIAPPWTVTLLGSPRGGASTMASSPSTNTAMRPRKCAAMTGPLAATEWMRSTTEAVSLRVSVIGQCWCCDFPSPLWGGVGVGVGRECESVDACALPHDPHPALPTGGREKIEEDQAMQLSNPSAIILPGRL